MAKVYKVEINRFGMENMPRVSRLFASEEVANRYAAELKEMIRQIAEQNTEIANASYPAVWAASRVNIIEIDDEATAFAELKSNVQAVIAYIGIHNQVKARELKEKEERRAAKTAERLANKLNAMSRR